MLVQDKYKKIKKFSHTGIISSLSVPTDASVGNKKVDLQISGKSKTMKLCEGKSVFVISDVIGISENTEIVIFYLDDVVVLELVKGFIYVPNEDGTINVINAKNKIRVLNKEIEDIETISWKTRDDMFYYCSHLVEGRFNLVDALDVKSYTNNLMFHLKLSYSLKENSLFSMNLLDVFYGLGVGQFNFEVKEPISKAENLEVEEPIFNDDYILDKNKKKAYKQGKDIDYSDYEYDYSSDDEYYSEKDVVLPYNMHEVDIFNDYNSEDEE